jgi:hypothetical protein
LAVTVIYFGFLLWVVVLPNHAARFYRWFYGQAAVDQRRLDAITPNRLRFGGLVILTFSLVLVLITSR